MFPIRKCMLLALASASLFSSLVSTAMAQEAATTDTKPGTILTTPDLKTPGITEFSPTATTLTPFAATERSVELEARLTPDSPPMKYGLTWRIFLPIPGADGKLPLLASHEGGSATFDLAPGEYFVNVAFGRAGTTKKLNIPTAGPPEKQVLVLDAGGLVLNAVSGTDRPIPSKELRFAIYSSEVREDGERGLVMKDVKPNQVVRLNAGTYHVVSDYGSVNAVIRADIQVQAAKLTSANIQHKAANITLKLVSSEGGEAIADTAWSILIASGDVVYESVGAFPEMVLAEGEYTAIARNKEKLYQRDFKVVAGVDANVEILMKD